MFLIILIILNIKEIHSGNNEELFKEMGRLTQHCLDLTCTNLHDLREADKPESSLRNDINCLRMCIFLHAKESSSSHLKESFEDYKRNVKAIERNECVGF